MQLSTINPGKRESNEQPLYLPGLQASLYIKSRKNFPGFTIAEFFYLRYLQGLRAMSYYDGDSWSNHELNEIKCAECGNEFDQQDREGGNICPACIEKEGEEE